jgi:DNA integrity scanning protein DisA with diadenylate cyclase activity
MKHLFLCILGLVVLSACNPEVKYADELKEIDTYTKKLDTVESVLNGIEFDSLIYMQEVASSNEKLIKRFYVNDTINQDFAQKLTYNKSVRKFLKGADKEKVKMYNELNALKSQFANLKTDIINGLYNKEQISNYLSVEKKDSDMLLKSVTEFDKIQKLNKSYFYFATPSISAYLTKIMNEKQSD